MRTHSSATTHPGTLTSTLKKRILLLSADTKLEKQPKVTPMEDLEARERQKAEANFRHALSRRTWWHLTREERSIIRRYVLNKDPFYRNMPEGAGLEIRCIDEVEKILLSEI